MFTAENFRRIFDVENRKGFDVAGHFFPQLEDYTFAVKNKVSEIRELRKKQSFLKPEEFFSALNKMKPELATLKSAKSNAVDEIMEQISENVSAPKFRIQLNEKDGPNGKPVYTIDGTAETYFTVKQIQRNIHRIYGVKQASRHDLSCQLRDTLSSKFPFELVRTDISSFYETVERKKLLGKLDEDHLLSASSMKFIKQIFDSYGQISGSNKGIPRGVGVSAYLSELYLRPLDRALKALSGVILYCRYVDDIVIVFARPPAGKSLGSYKTLVTDLISGYGLTPNAAKTIEIDLATKGAKKLDYLGYAYDISHYVDISPSIQKLARIEQRLDASFEDYHKTSSINPRRAYRDLVARIKFLTGNTRLAHSKANARTGIFYNNSLATNMSGFAVLDTKLKKEIALIPRKVLRARLKQCSFVKGFTERKYHTFSALELQRIVGAWKHG